MDKLFNTTAFRMVEQGIDAMSRQQKIIAQNIANADTPNYKCKYLYFDGVLNNKIRERSGEKYQKELNLATSVYVDTNTKDQPDGNNVDNDTQQALLTKNEFMYEALITQMNSEFNMMRASMRRN